MSPSMRWGFSPWRILGGDPGTGDGGRADKGPASLSGDRDVMARIRSANASWPTTPWDRNLGSADASRSPTRARSRWALHRVYIHARQWSDSARSGEGGQASASLDRLFKEWLGFTPGASRGGSDRSAMSGERVTPQDAIPFGHDAAQRRHAGRRARDPTGQGARTPRMRTPCTPWPPRSVGWRRKSGETRTRPAARGLAADADERCATRGGRHQARDVLQYVDEGRVRRHTLHLVAVPPGRARHADARRRVVRRPDVCRADSRLAPKEEPSTTPL